MRTILVPFDGSPNALRAVGYAIAQAEGTRTLVHLLNVQQPFDEYGMVAAYLSKQRHRHIMAERGRQILIPAVNRLQRTHVRHVTHVVHGDVAGTIVRTARRLKCESIIMGTRGMSALGNLVLGSVANKVIHLASTPVTLVK